MKQQMKSLFMSAVAMMSVVASSAQIAVDSKVESVKIGGYLGGRIADCIEHRVKPQDWNHLVEPFRQRVETHTWQSEFWGKWVQGAIASYRYNRDPELYDIIRQSAEAMMATQTPNGYIGTYRDDMHLNQWDIWGRKYTMLGLVAWYDLSGDKSALKAASRVLDHLMSEVGEGKTDIISTGNYHGMASSSVLEPTVYLYVRTKNPAYLDFANYIARRLNDADGPELIRKALEGVNVGNRFPHPKVWWSAENGHKAYEMMSCYEGLLELYKITGREEYLLAVERVVENIIATEINIAGSGAAFECWYNGNVRQTQPTYHTMETCVTFTWIQLCNRLLQVSRNAKLADQIERTVYNALLASLRADGGQISKYSPLEGWRSSGEEQCGMHINCCNANGPRGFAMIPQVAYQVDGDKLYVNLYGESSASLSVGEKRGVQVEISQRSDYPASGTTEITLSPKKSSRFSVVLRIPEWSAVSHTSVAVNGEAVAVEKSGWLSIEREWTAGDKISLSLDMRGRLVELNNYQAIERGPVVLARDSRMGDGFVDETSIVQSKDGYVELTAVAAPDFAWLTFSVPMVLGTDLEGSAEPSQIKMCDFGSAGNTWDRSSRYRVWLPKTLHVMTTPYVPYNRDPKSE